jgi:asparagine synthase (glutamine-hydrolysing)
LLGLPGIEASADPSAVYQYLNFGYVPASTSIWKGVRRLPPGHVLRVTAGSALPRPTAFWDLAYDERDTSPRTAAETLYGLTAEAVAAALGGTRVKETGAFLSGGTDSSTVVGLMGRATGERPNAFSIGFPDPRYDELAYAELAARHFGAAHYTRTVTPEDALETLPTLVEAYDEPFGNNSAIGTLLCARLARECGVRTLLAGDGGDEIFGGNDRYRTDGVFARYGRVPRVLRERLLEPVLRGLPDGGGSLLGKAQRYVQRARIPNPRRFYLYEFFFAQEGQGLLGPDLLAAVDRDAPWRVLEDHYRRVRASSDLNRLLYLDLKLTIADNDLLKVTRTAELAGVRVRFPLLDLRLVEFMASVPAELKVRGLEKRHLFKRAFRALLPPETLAKRKHGFGVPTSTWLRQHPGFRALAHDTLTAARAQARGYLARDAVARLLALHEADSTPYYGDVVWNLLMLELWHRRHLDGAAA